MSNRMMRADSEISKVLSDIIQNRLSDPRFSEEIITVTKVNTSSDFRHCKIWVSILSNNQIMKNKIIDLLKKSSGFIKRELSQDLDLPFIPELVFELDENIEYSEKINNILSELNVSKENNVESDD